MDFSAGQPNWIRIGASSSTCGLESIAQQLSWPFVSSEIASSKANPMTDHARQLRNRLIIKEESLYAIGWNNLDALDTDSGHRPASFSLAIVSDRGCPNFAQNIVTFNELAENGVLSVE